MTPKECLDLVKIDTNGEKCALRQYFMALLLALWREGEGFSGKRPLGISGWEFDIYAALVRAGVVDGIFDEAGSLEWVDDKAGYKVVEEAIKECFRS